MTASMEHISSVPLSPKIGATTKTPGERESVTEKLLMDRDLNMAHDTGFEYKNHKSLGAASATYQRSTSHANGAILHQQNSMNSTV